MRKLVTLAITASALAFAAPALAATTVLTFDGLACTGTDGGNVDRNCTGQNDYLGGNYGSTAQLAVSYDAADNQNLPVTSLRSTYPFGSSDLGAISLYGGANDYSTITFTPTTGFEVSFKKFDWRNGTATFTEIAADLLGPGGATLATFSGAFSGTFTPNTAYYASPLTFRFRTPSSGKVLIDNVTFDVRAVAAQGAVPEPATWAMMLFGFGLVGGTMRRRSATRVFATL